MKDLKSSNLKTPLLFIIFNRPDLTQRVFNEIKHVKPEKLYVAADGPREGVEGELGKCLAAREIINQVDWDCKVYKLFREKNVGCKWGPALAIKWLFENEEEGIILEDDGVPNQSFFWFCQDLLEYYRHDTRIMHISAYNLQFGKKRGSGSYYFSKYAHGVTWATWRRAWTYFDGDIKTFPVFKEKNQIKNIFENELVQKYWLNILQSIYDGKLMDSWDYQWLYSIWIQNGLSILPNVNLICNIGYGPEATHTTCADDRSANLETYEIKEITHPTFILQDKEADEYEAVNTFGIKRPTLKHKVKNKLRNLVPQYIKKLLKG